jgi:hypothetical protein
MAHVTNHAISLRTCIGGPSDPVAVSADESASVTALLKAWLAQLPATAPDPPVPTRNMVRVPAAAFGSPEDDIATSTVAPWTAVSLLKGILKNLNGS